MFEADFPGFAEGVLVFVPHPRSSSPVAWGMSFLVGRSVFLFFNVT